VITGVHLLLHSQDAEADRAFLRDVLGWPFVSAGGPDDHWLIFRVPAAEAGVHPSDGPFWTEFLLMCEDLTATLAELAVLGVTPAREVQETSWGAVTALALPSGAELGLYQPKQATAHDQRSQDGP
jgi:predicted enzyme related to lactoylglutathione lyase